MVLQVRRVTISVDPVWSLVSTALTLKLFLLCFWQTCLRWAFQVLPVILLLMVCIFLWRTVPFLFLWLWILWILWLLILVVLIASRMNDQLKLPNLMRFIQKCT